MPIPPYPSVPAPTTYVSGPVLTSELRADVTNAVNFLANRPSFLGICTAGPAIASGGNGTAVGLDTELYDNWAGHSALGSTPALYYCQAPGWYLVEAYISWNYNSGSTVSFTTNLQTITSGGTAITTGEIHPVNDTRTPGPGGVEFVSLSRTGTPGTASTDSVAMLARQNSGSSVDLNTGSQQQPRLSVRWVAANSGTASLSVPANASWPTPPAYVTSSFLNTSIRNTINFLSYPPIFRATYAAGSNTLPSQTFPAGTKIALDTVTVDNYSGWSASNNWYVAPAAGVYYVAAQVHVASQGSAGSIAAGTSVNAGTTSWGSSARSPSNTSGFAMVSVKRLRLNAGDTVALMGSNSNASALTINSGTRLIIFWESS